MPSSPHTPGARRVERSDVTVPTATASLPGLLWRPDDLDGLVVFAHGSGSSRHSTRNQHVAERLNGRGLATLLFDLLTEEESTDRRNVFDVDLLAGRLAEATRWAADDPRTGSGMLGLFGASTGAAAALSAAADLAGDVDAVVSRGGRPDLSPDLARVTVPVLLVVGGRDEAVLDLNRRAAAELRGERRIEVVPGATHLFEEPGALEEVARLAGDWFTRRR